jgi:hypothetical protein
MPGRLLMRRIAALPEALPYPHKTGAGGIPRVLDELIKRLARYIEAPEVWLPSLNRANGSARQQRTERSVACVQLLRASIKYLDLVTMRVGTPNGRGGLENLTLSFLAKQAGLELRRAERAVSDLRRAGLLSVRPRCERGDDGYKGFAAIKFLPPALFGAFGLAKWLRHERTKATLRRQLAQAAVAKQRRLDSREHAAGQLWLAGMQRTAESHISARRSAPPHKQSDAVAEYERQVHILAGQIKLADPRLDRDTCFARARLQLGPPIPS